MRTAGGTMTHPPPSARPLRSMVVLLAFALIQACASSKAKPAATTKAAPAKATSAAKTAAAKAKSATKTAPRPKSGAKPIAKAAATKVPTSTRFTPDKALFVCPKMKISNRPKTDASRKIVRYRPFV
ncbi:MAG: hypothetical protein AAFV29_10445, partial [Myxococcota bacterium]